MTETVRRQENWRPVSGYGGRYDVSDLARVRQWESVVKRDGAVPRRARILQPGRDGNGLCLWLFDREGNRRIHYVAQLVREAFEE